MDGWQDMDPAALGDAYANAPHIPLGDAYPRMWAEAAAAMRAARPPEVLRYGDHPRQTVDLFQPDGAARGLVAFVHGGYWLRFGPSDWSHLALGALSHGWAVALPGYVLAPEARVAAITAMVARALDAAAEAVPGPLRLAGHSAGGHLVARMIMADAAPACADRIEAVLPISPVADLRPLVPQPPLADLRLDAREAAAESPALGRPCEGPRVSIHVGADERPSFLWQAEALAAAWDAPLTVVPDAHHFDVIDALADPDGAMVADLLA